MKKLSQEEFLDKIKENYGQYNYDFSKIKYIDADTKIIINCKEHGDFQIIPYKLFKNKLHICTSCKKNQINIRVTNTDSFIKKANIIHNNKYQYNKSKYINNFSNIVVTCPEHGDFNLIVDSHLSAQKGCPNCKKRHQLNQKEVLERFIKIHNGKYQYPNFKYKTVYGYIDVICPKHGVFKQKIMNHLNGHGCYECGKDVIRKDNTSFVERSKTIHNGKYDYSLTNYNHSQKKVKIICPKHGEFEQIARDHIHGNGCWNCAVEGRNFISSYENEIVNFIKQLNPNINIIQSYSENKKEIDIFLPEYNLGLEINGNYWHSHLCKTKEYHKEKSDYYENKKINIFHIWEYNWISKPEIIKSMIQNKLNLTPNKVHARKCIIKEINSETYRLFCNINHIQGFSPSKIKLGLFHDGVLVACMGFGNLRSNLGNKNKDNDYYELIRYCNLLNYNIVGGASKLLKYFETKYQPKYLVSYADNDYSKGNMYVALGFENKEFTNISYSYYNPKTQTISNRFNYRKSELIKMGYDKNLTEFEITNQMGLYRLYNSGTRKFEKVYL